MESVSQLRVETSIQKIEKMELALEDFYRKQKHSFESLKQYSIGIKSGCLKNEENITKMETNIISLYNSAITYTQEIGKTMEIANFPTKRWEHPEFYPHNHTQTNHANPHFFSETFDEYNEEQLELVKKRLFIILAKLQAYIPCNSKNEFQEKLSKAQLAYNNNQLLEASRIVQAILNDKNNDHFVGTLCMNIVDETMALKL